MNLAYTRLCGECTGASYSHLCAPAEIVVHYYRATSEGDRLFYHELNRELMKPNSNSFSIRGIWRFTSPRAVGKGLKNPSSKPFFALGRSPLLLVVSVYGLRNDEIGDHPYTSWSCCSPFKKICMVHSSISPSERDSLVDSLSHIRRMYLQHRFTHNRDDSSCAVCTTSATHKNG